MLAKLPGDRVATAAAVALALEPFARGADLPALATTVPADQAASGPPRAGAVTTSHSPEVGKAPTWSRVTPPAPAAPARPTTTRRRWLAAAAAGTLLAALGGAGAVLLRRPAPQPDEKEKDPPVTEPPLKPGVWNPMLGREPATLRWPPAPTNSYQDYRAEEKELRANCQDVGLLKLGESKSGRYKVAVTLHQNPWAGNVGLFFGYQTCQLPDGPAERYHVLELAIAKREEAATYLRVDWTFALHIGPAGKQRDVSERFQASRSFLPSAKPHRLVLAVGPQGLETVFWGDATEKPLKLAELIGPNSVPVPAPPPKAGTSHGAFGIYLHSGNGVFRDAAYFYEEER
jgi:hypothetical protein